MADDGDYHIESTDAGASATIPMEAGQIKKGGWVLFEKQNESTAVFKSTSSYYLGGVYFEYKYERAWF